MKNVLVGMQPLPGNRLEDLHLRSSVRRPDMLDLPRPATVGLHDLNRGALLAVFTVRR